MNMHKENMHVQACARTQGKYAHARQIVIFVRLIGIPPEPLQDMIVLD